MRSVLISDNRDSLIGMRLAGIEGYLVNDAEEAKKVINDKIADPETGIIFLTELAAEMIREDLIAFRQKTLFPLITVIPDRHGFTHNHEITKYITEAIGM